MSKKFIEIKGAKEHNLKNIDIKIPRDKFVVITGLSGSGKSSLAFDTIYAEGQRRYVESLSSYARQFLGQMEKPHVEYIEGLSPAISIDQKTTNNNPRSTVGTVTEIYDYLRLLFARIGVPHCTECGSVISSQSIDQIVDNIMEYEEKTKIQIISPVIIGRKGQHKNELNLLRKEGYVRVRIDGDIFDLNEEIELDKNIKHNIDVVVDRLIIKDGIRNRLADSVETALNLTDGRLVINIIDGEDKLYNTNFACPIHGAGITEMEPRMFSFNSPYGSCPECSGLGFKLKVDPDLIVPNDELSVKEGAIEPYKNSQNNTYYRSVVKSIVEFHGFDENTPFKKLSKKAKKEIFYGSKRKFKFTFNSHFAEGEQEREATFEGIVNNFERRYIETNSDYSRDRIKKYMSLNECKVCEGKKLKPEVLAVTFNDRSISEVVEMSIKDAYDFFMNVNLSKNEMIIGEEILKEIKGRLKFLIDVGLNYLTLSRRAGTLSGGESQRIRLATQIGSGLVGVLYILDEPSIGLHQKDNRMLLKSLRNLTDVGNTLIVVEHDEETIIDADFVVDMGPYAGEHGGEIIAIGTPEDIINNEASITGKYLSGKMKVKIPEERRKFNNVLKLKGARQNNLRNVNVDIPLGIFTCVTGVSGSGKSSLINQTLYKIIAKEIGRSTVRPGDYDSIEGLEFIDKVIDIDQSPIGRTPRSNPATYTKLFDDIRDIFAMVPEAKKRGYKKGRFSFNVKGGRCEACKGDGLLKIEMHFLADVYVECDVCKGKRYNKETLQVKYKDKNIAEVLDMTVEEALEFFKNIPKIKVKLQTLFDVGLGYIKLGQPSTQLSGGEAQRIKLARELSKRSTGKTLYILDEPTTGLHMADVHMLIEVLDRLVGEGNSIVVIEHNLDVIKSADYIIDLGPDGGDNGGKIIAKGTPEEVAKVKNSYTGMYLNKCLMK
ncbi:excinuclease ABC subunit UvrA [Clostridiaceae bacterium HSG29]|nr:excinuclease ABC subunit UvrA [Clostridiaceae bacterium HSG29]